MGKTSKVSNVQMSSFLSASPSVADEEKLDERAKLSVAAKRSLFRVSFNNRLFVLSSTGEMCFQSRRKLTMLDFSPPSSHLCEDSDLKTCKYSWFNLISCRDQTKQSILMEHISLHICEIDPKDAR